MKILEYHERQANPLNCPLNYYFTLIEQIFQLCSFFKCRKKPTREETKS